MITYFKSLFKQKQIKTTSSRSYRTDGPEKLLETLRALDRGGKGAFARNSYYAAEYNVTDRTIRRWLAALVERGDISVSGQGKGRRIHVLKKQEIKEQASVFKKSNPDKSTRTHCRTNVRDKSGQCPGNVRDYSISKDPKILKSLYQAKWEREAAEIMKIADSMYGS